MSFCSVLAKIFGDVQKGIQIFEGIEPIAYPLVPPGAKATVSTLTDDLTSIGAAVTSASAVVATVKVGATPADVAAAAAPLVSNILQSSELMSGKKIGNQAAYTAGVAALSAAVTQLLDSLEAK
jgi:hypothetical protein